MAEQTTAVALASLVGGWLLKLAGDRLSDRRADKRAREARADARAERLAEAQREALLELQEVISRTTELSGKFYHFNIAASREPGLLSTPGSRLLKDDFFAATDRIAVLSARIADEPIRDESRAFAGFCLSSSRPGHPSVPWTEDFAVIALNRSATLNELIGQRLRAVDAAPLPGRS